MNTLDVCPQCRRRTIWRFGGEWCRYCHRFIEEVHGISGVLRALRDPR
jgi:hypothetical protein